MAMLENVEVRWASVLQPNTQFEHAWEIQVMLTPDLANRLNEEAKALGFKNLKGIKTDDDGNKIIRFKRKVKKANGDENNPPVVCGPGGRNDKWTQNIGNGSICNVQYSLVAYDNKFGKGITTDLKGVQVIKHVPYGVQDGDEFGAVEGATPSKTSPSTSSDDYDDDDFN